MNADRKDPLKTFRETVETSFETAGEQLIRRVSSAMRKELWGRTIIQLAWTAGPVTYLALQGGYALGYGKSAPPNLFIYFAIYTVIAGIFAIAMRFLYNLTRGEEVERAREAILDALNKLPDLVLLVRNQTLLYYDNESRKYLAAKYLLENPDAAAETIGIAVKEVTDDEELAQMAATIEVYRKHGLFAGIDTKVERIEQLLSKHSDEITHVSPEVAGLLKKRLRGDAPKKRTGRPRTEGFIQRVITAGEEHNFELMSLNDAEELFTLLYELLADRKITVFSLKYVGSREFTEVSTNLETARIHLREAAYLRNSKLRRLAELFVESDEIEVVPAAAPVLTKLGTMYANVMGAMDQFYTDVKNRLDAVVRKRKAFDLELHHDLEKLKTAIYLHKSLYTANQEVKRKYYAFKRAEKRYRQVRTGSAKSFPLTLLSGKDRGKGIRIVERYLHLSEKSKLRLARELSGLIGNIETGNITDTAIYKPYTPNEKRFEAIDYKRLAFDMATRLDRELHLTRFETQYAIESSHAPFLSALEMGLTTATKTGWAVSLVKEVQRNAQKAIHRLAKVLVDYHSMPLKEKDIDVLARKYGADREILSQMNPDERTMQVSPAYLHPPRLLFVKPLEPRYQALIDFSYKARIL